MLLRRHCIIHRPDDQYYGKGEAMSTVKVAKARLSSLWSDFALDNV
jgi:hypothetical protein